MNEIQLRHQKQLAVMRGFLEGKEWYSALKAMEIVRNLEVGTRKDGQTPKFQHQLAIVRLLTTLYPHYIFPEETITAGFLHDILEDHSSSFSQHDLELEFSPLVAEAVEALTKKSPGRTKTKEFYFQEISNNPIASIGKCVDRAHNLQTMQGVFSPQKQLDYVQEVEDYFFPMIRYARRKYPQQYQAYENLRIILRNQTHLIKLLNQKDV